jgi:hypothetical protein
MKGFMVEQYLLPHFLKKIGWVFFLVGIIALYLRFGMGIKPEWLQVKVFAMYSSLFDVRYFTFSENNISEEIGMFFTGLGLAMVTLSKEKMNTKMVGKLRQQAFIFTVYFNTLLFLIFVLFFFGWGFLAYMAVNLFLWLFSYNVIFLILKQKYKKNNDV